MRRQTWVAYLLGVMTALLAVWLTRSFSWRLLTGEDEEPAQQLKASKAPELPVDPPVLNRAPPPAAGAASQDQNRPGGPGPVAQAPALAPDQPGPDAPVAEAPPEAGKKASRARPEPVKLSPLPPEVSLGLSPTAGAIRGVVRYVGTPPASEHWPASRDRVCEGRFVTEVELSTDVAGQPGLPTRSRLCRQDGPDCPGLRGAAVLLLGHEGHRDSAEPPQVSMELAQCSISPRLLFLKDWPRGGLPLLNPERRNHNLLVAGKPRFMSEVGGHLAGGQGRPADPTEIRCETHPGERAFAYFNPLAEPVLTDAQGEFLFPALKDDRTLALVAWHPERGWSQPVHVEVRGNQLTTTALVFQAADPVRRFQDLRDLLPAALLGVQAGGTGKQVAELRSQP